MKKKPSQRHFGKIQPRKKGDPSPTKGKTLVKEALTRKEVTALIGVFNNGASGRRNLAMTTLMYRAGLKVGEVCALERYHYEPGTNRLTVPERRYAPEHEIDIDDVTANALDQWVSARKTLGARPDWPLFVSISVHERGNRVAATYIREMLRRAGEKAGIEKRMHTEGLRATYDRLFAGRTAPTEVRIASYLDEDFFIDRYPNATDKWRAAHALTDLDSARYATRIGHDCRETLDAFADEVLAHHEIKMKRDAGTVAKLRAALGQEVESRGVNSMFDALMEYWLAVSNITQRQEHGGKREGEPLTAEDGRRVLFQTMCVMYEVDRALLDTRSGA